VDCHAEIYSARDDMVVTTVVIPEMPSIWW